MQAILMNTQIKQPSSVHKVDSFGSTLETIDTGKQNTTGLPDLNTSVPSKEAVDLKDFTKTVFDHFRNYFICASVFIAGLTAINHPEWRLVGPIGVGVGYLVILLATLLTILNSSSVLKSIWTTFKPIGRTRNHRDAGYNFRLFILFVYIAIIYILVAISINLKF